MTVSRAIAISVAAVAVAMLARAAAGPPPPYPSAVPSIDELIGINVHITGAPLPGELEQLRGGGFRTIRAGESFDWTLVEQQKGVYNWTYADALVAGADAAGVRVWIGLSSHNKFYDNNQPPTSPEGLKAYANYAAAIAARYPGHFIEMINEPNDPSTGAYANNASAYAALASAAGPAIHAASPTMRFIGPATENIGLPWLQTVFEGRALDHFDAITVHPYRSDSPETFAADARTIATLIREYAPLSGPKAKGVPFMSGEWGYTPQFGGAAPSNETQAKVLARQQLVSITATGGISIWYGWRDAGFGVVDTTPHPGRSPPFDIKPAYTAAQTLSKMLSGFVYVERVHAFQSGMTTTDDWVLLFENPSTGATALAVWTSASFGHVIRLPGGRGCWNVTDYMGASLPQICEDPRGLHVNVTDAPQYLVQQRQTQ